MKIWGALFVFLLIGGRVSAKTCHQKIDEIEKRKSGIEIFLKKEANGLCFAEGNFKGESGLWRFQLIFNKNRPTGPAWFVPHDNENSAFDAGIYAVKRYGGGVLAIESGGHRLSKGRDPNRMFNKDRIYAKNILFLIDIFRVGPYFALHNNSNGINGRGKGTISILISSKKTRSYPAPGKVKTGKGGGMMDEDTVVYIAGRGAEPKEKIQKINRMGLHVKYEHVTPNNDDGSFSNFVVLYRKDKRYFNVETEHGDTETQKMVVDKIVGFSIFNEGAL